LGAGGAARAAVYALARAGADSVVVINRTAERAAFLVDDLNLAFPDSTLSFKELSAQTLIDLDHQVDLIVNTTSVGMYPHVEDSPWPIEVPLPNGATVCDLVYNPLETVFLAQARAAGAPTIDGLGMLIHQGAFALEQWTGQEAPVDIMRQACLEKLHFS